jgi:hypothetical protein
MWIFYRSHGGKTLFLGPRPIMGLTFVDAGPIGSLANVTVCRLDGGIAR